MQTLKVLHSLVPKSLSILIFINSPHSPIFCGHPEYIHHILLFFLCFLIFGYFYCFGPIQFYSVLKSWLLSSSPESHDWYFFNWRQSYFSVHFLCPIFMNILINFYIGFLFIYYQNEFPVEALLFFYGSYV